MQVAPLLVEGEVTAEIDVYPQYDHGAFDTYVTEIFNEHKNKQFKNVFSYIAPKGTATSLLTLLSEIDPEKKVHSVYKEERKRVVHVLKELPVTITGLMGYDRAVVVDGGLLVTEIDGKTMRSRKYVNLFITGDLLNITRPSGGFSLQLCWTTGWVAGSNA